MPLTSIRPAPTEKFADASIWLLLACILWAPVPLGSNRPWAESLLAAGLGCSLMLSLIGRLFGARQPEHALRAARWVVVLLALFCALHLLQLLVGTPRSSFQANTASWVPQTLSPWDTQQSLLRTLSYASALLTVLFAVRTRRQCRWVLGTLLTAGVIQACVGVLLSRSGVGYVYFYEYFPPDSRASGTLSNANHFAGYLSLSMGAGVGLLIAQYEGVSSRGRGWQAQVATAIDFLLSLKVLLRLMLVMLVIGLVISHSRMGNAAFVAALLVAGLTVAVRCASLRRPALLLLGTMVLIDLLIVGHWIGFDRVAQRLEQTPMFLPDKSAPSAAPGTNGSWSAIPPPSEDSVEARLQVPLLAAKLAAQRPLWGHGAGTFHLSFSSFKPSWVFGGHWNHAHNDYTEVAVDMGLVGLTLWVGIGALAAVRAVSLIQDKHPRLNRGVGVATLFAIIATALQSTVEFGLQIPAIALNLTVLVSLVWVVSSLPRESVPATKNDTHATTARDRSLLR